MQYYNRIEVIPTVVASGSVCKTRQNNSSKKGFLLPFSYNLLCNTYNLITYNVLIIKSSDLLYD